MIKQIKKSVASWWAEYKYLVRLLVLPITVGILTACYSTNTIGFASAIGTLWLLAIASSLQYAKIDKPIKREGEGHWPSIAPTATCPCPDCTDFREKRVESTLVHKPSH